jgi:hypothetical protein
MRNRLANLPQNALVTTIRQLQTEITALKERQRISGQSGVLSYTSQTTGTWDATGTVGTDADTYYNSTTFTVAWVGDGSQAIAFANVAFSLFVNGTDSAHQLTPQTHSWTDGTRQAAVSYLGETLISHHTYEVQFGLITLKAITYYVKGYAVGSSPGTVTVTS